MTISRGEGRGGSRPQRWGQRKQPVYRWMADVLEARGDQMTISRGGGGAADSRGGDQTTLGREGRRGVSWP
jgi:hypothetical protein